MARLRSQRHGRHATSEHAGSSKPSLASRDAHLHIDKSKQTLHGYVLCTHLADPLVA